jgi:hypothetical protein
VVQDCRRWCVILEPDTLKLVKLEEAVKFWGAWWKEEQTRK